MTEHMQDPSEETRVRFVLPDGRTRDASLTTQELASLTARSTDVTPTRRRVVQRLVKPGTFVVSAVITAIMVPAITTQWNDRKADSKLKSDLVQRMSEAAAVAVSNVRFLNARATPEQHVADRLCGVRQPSKDQIKRCEEAERNADFATAKVTTQTRTNWRRAAAAHEAQVATYFRGLADDWGRYNEAMNEFLQMFVTCTDRTSDQARRLLNYLGEDRDDPKWSSLFVKPGDPNCTQFHVASGAVDGLTDGLLERRKGLLQDLVTADTRGLSTTRDDLLRDVWWVLLVVGAGALGYLALVIREERQPRRER